MERSADVGLDPDVDDTESRGCRGLLSSVGGEKAFGDWKVIGLPAADR
jgi:hypothetical protein